MGLTCTSRGWRWGATDAGAGGSASDGTGVRPRVQRGLAGERERDSTKPDGIQGGPMRYELCFDQSRFHCFGQLAHILKHVRETFGHTLSEVTTTRSGPHRNRGWRRRKKKIYPPQRETGTDDHWVPSPTCSTELLKE